jgi:hypothetical protein
MNARFVQYFFVLKQNVEECKWKGLYSRRVTRPSVEDALLRAHPEMTFQLMHCSAQQQQAGKQRRSRR